jgi:Xaa-Pro aminopeptidase
MMKKYNLGALLCMYDENVRYLTGTLTPGWNRLKPGLRYAVLCGDGAPILFEQGDIGMQIERHVPWLPKENVRHSFAWIKGAAGPASKQQVTKFANALVDEMRRHGVLGQKLGVDFVDINMIEIFLDKNIAWADGMTAMMEARAVKNEDPRNLRLHLGSHTADRADESDVRRRRFPKNEAGGVLHKHRARRIGRRGRVAAGARFRTPWRSRT